MQQVMLKTQTCPQSCPLRKSSAASILPTRDRGRRHLCRTLPWVQTEFPSSARGTAAPSIPATAAGQLSRRGVRTRRRAPRSVTCSAARAGEAGSSLGLEKAREPRTLGWVRGAGGGLGGRRGRLGAPRGSGGRDAESELRTQGPRSVALAWAGPGRPGRRAALPGVDLPLPPLAQLTPWAVFKWTGDRTGLPTRGYQPKTFSVYTGEMQIPMFFRSFLSSWIDFPNPFAWYFLSSQDSFSRRTVKCMPQTRPFPLWNLYCLSNKWLTQR